MTDMIPIPQPKPALPLQEPAVELAAVQGDDLGPAYTAHVSARQVVSAASEELAAAMARRSARAAGKAPAEAGGTEGPPKPASAPQAPQAGAEATPGLATQAMKGLNDVGEWWLGHAVSSTYGATAGLPSAVAGGVMDAAQSALGLIEDAGNWLNRNVADLTLPTGLQVNPDLPEVPSTTGTGTEKTIRAAVQFLTGFKGAGMLMKGAGVVAAEAGTAAETAQAMAQGAVADFVAMDPKAKRLSNLWQDMGLPENMLTDYLAAQPDDSAAEGRFKNALEGVLPGALTQAVTSVARAWKASAQAAGGAGDAAAAIDTAPKVTTQQISDLFGETGGERLAGRARTPTAAAAARKTGAAVDATAEVPLEEGAKGIARGEHAPELYVNWGRVDTPDDVKNAMAQMADAFRGDIEEARRGVQTFEQTKLGADAENAWSVLVERRQGQPLNDRQTLAVRQLWASSAAKTAELAKAAADNPGEAALFAFRKQLATHHMVQREVIAARTETARALSSWRIPAGTDATRAKEIQFLLAETGGADVTRELAQRIAVLAKGGSVQGLDVAVEKGMAARTIDGVREAFLAGLLSSPKTHIVNVTSNLSVAAQQILERAASEKVSAALGTNGGVAAGEAMAQVHGLMASWKDALRYAGKAAMTGESGFGVGRVESARPGAIGASTKAGSVFAQGTDLGRAVDLLGQVIRTPMRALVSEDEFFKTIGYRMELHAQALRQATDDVAKGLIGKDQLKSRMADYVANPPENIRLAAVDQALYQTFNSAPEWFARSVMQMRERIPGAWVLVPFIRTPGNIMKYTLERTPLAPILGRFRQDVAAGGARRDLALARMAAGTFTMMTAVDFAMSGVITGGGPKDPVSRAALPPGWQPYSVKVGDRYWSYNRLDAVGNLMGIASDLVDVLHNTDLNRQGTKDIEDLVTAMPLMVANGFLSKTYVQGVSKMVDALHDPERYGEGFWQGLAGSLVPAGVAAGTRGLDPVARDTRSMMDAVMARTPGLSDNLAPRRDAWGREQRYDSGLGWAYDLFSPVASRKEAAEPIDREVARLEISVQKPGRVVQFGGEPVDLDRYEGAYSRYLELAGNKARDPAWNLGTKDLLNRVIEGKHPLSSIYRLYTDGPDGGKQAFIRDQVSKGRERARAMLVREFPALRRDLEAMTSTPKIKGAPAVGVPRL